jgi:CheY-like chemotaxis protein
MSRATAMTSVLTVEDDPIVRADLRLVLETAGFEVCADARDGVEAVELAREHEPDVILLDLGLPRLDGVDATRLILAEQDVPIVALTGRSDDLADEAVRAGATSVVRKPFEEGAVVRALRDAVIARRRRVSRATLADLLGLLGYPQEWSEELEQSAFERGHVWQQVQPSTAPADRSRRSSAATDAVTSNPHRLTR